MTKSRHAKNPKVPKRPKGASRQAGTQKEAGSGDQSQASGDRQVTSQSQTPKPMKSCYKAFDGALQPHEHPLFNNEDGPKEFVNPAEAATAVNDYLRETPKAERDEIGEVIFLNVLTY